MKKLFFTALAVVSLATAALAPVVANARGFHNGSTVADTATASRIQQTTQYQ
nr:hypothetical protein [uncultured Rhodopila sp.]